MITTSSDLQKDTYVYNICIVVSNSQRSLSLELGFHQEIKRERERVELRFLHYKKEKGGVAMKSGNCVNLERE